MFILDQGCPFLLMEDHHPAEFQKCIVVLKNLIGSGVFN